jgi:hypothetical protein
MRNSNNNTKKSIKASEQYKAILEEKTTQTDDESAQFGQDLADLEALRFKNNLYSLKIILQSKNWQRSKNWNAH